MIMRSVFARQFILGLGSLIVGGLCAADLAAFPPGKGKGPKEPPGPPPDAEVRTVSGTVKEFTTAPKGEVDGLVLNDGTWVHWPPHLEERFSGLAVQGDKVRVTGYWETGRKGETKLEVSTLTNLRTQKAGRNPDRPLADPGRALPGKAGDIEQRLHVLEDRLDQLLQEVKRLQRKK
jgi:hypothetical protein